MKSHKMREKQRKEIYEINRAKVANFKLSKLPQFVYYKPFTGAH